MDEEFRKRKLEINRHSKNVMIILLLTMAWSISMAYIGIDNTMFMIDAMLVMLRVEGLQRELLLTFYGSMISILPTIITILCNVKIHKINKENEKLQIERTTYLSKKIYEENKSDIDAMLEQGKILSRKELMNLLNMTKTELVKIEKTNKSKCKTPDELLLNYLQNGLEDILFPSVVDEKKDYTRTRKK